ncbi:MAG TPA: MFS transporter [Caulobacteraceae bacterium]|jgi:MFS family permease|nr:MFS transporter [Caulobacteraceae bacterium]
MADQHLERLPGMATVIAASAAGTAFEWYDFFIFGNLTPIIAKHFFAGVNELTGFILALATFALGFFMRPFGALVFGLFGDAKGRKVAFLVTITGMGLATLLIGFLPDFDQCKRWMLPGITAPILLVALRAIQGFALGGEYGGAAIYVAEHARRNNRGGATSWIQTSAGFGLLGALGMILALRTNMGGGAFDAWGWRIPFLMSAVLLALSLWIRLKLGESPAFKRMQAETVGRRAPFRETFLQWKNLKYVLLALFGVTVAQGAVWYCAFFYSQFFMQKILKVDDNTVSELIAAATVASAVLYVAFGYLSDKVGRKPVMLFGMILALACYLPITGHSAFHYLTRFGNPDLATAQATAPVTVIADPKDCTFQFDPVGKAKFVSSCEIAQAYLTNAGVSYVTRPAPPGIIATVMVGKTSVPSVDARPLTGTAQKEAKAAAEGRLKAALKAAGYPAKADPAKVDFTKMLIVMLVLTVAATALYGPQAAALVELFPTRVRYTGMGVPYNIGVGWVGGFLPAVAFAMNAASGDMYFGLWYATIFTAISVVVSLIFLPETRGRDLNTITT